MTDPLRWKETESEAIKTLLGELSKVEPSPETREAIWAKLSAFVPSGSVPGASGGGASAPSTVTSGAKLAGLAGVTILGGVLALWRATSPTPQASMEIVESPVRALATAIEPLPTDPHVNPKAIAKVEASTPVMAETTAKAIAPTPRVGTRSPAPLPSHIMPSAKSVAMPVATAAVSLPFAAASVASQSASGAASARSVDSLRGEAEGVQRARRLLRSNNPSASLSELDRLAKLVPNGPLEEEREVLTIEALFALGSSDVACRRADRFLFERSQSVHSARVRALCGKDISKILPAK